MKTIEPTHQEIMRYLDCCHYSKWHKGQCTCKTKQQFRECYEQTKSFLTKTVLDDEEIKQGQEANAKAMAKIDEALSWVDQYGN